MSTIALEGVLERAAAQSVLLRLTAFINGHQRGFRARIASVLGEAGADGIWIHFPDEPVTSVNDLAAALPQCWASLAMDDARYTFNAVVRKRDKHFWMNERRMCDALLLTPPDDLRQIDQRASERLLITDRSGVTAQLFRLAPPPSNSGSPALQPVPIAATLRDLSSAGAGFVCPMNRQLVDARNDELVRCDVQFRGTNMSLPATLAQVSVISHRTVRVGLTFDRQTTDPVAQRHLDELDKVVEELLRQRAGRMGAKPGIDAR